MGHTKSSTTHHSTARLKSFFEYSLLPRSFSVAPRVFRSFDGEQCRRHRDATHSIGHGLEGLLIRDILTRYQREVLSHHAHAVHVK